MLNARISVILPLLLIAIGAAGAPTDPPRVQASTDQAKKAPSGNAQTKFYTEQVLPIFKASCYSCHSGASPSGNLSLTSRAGILKGGDSGPAVLLQKPESSLLVNVVNYRVYKMPPTGKLSAAQIDTLTRWVKMGMPWAAGGKPEPAPRAHIIPPKVTPQAMKFWSFRPVVRPAVPQVKRAAWVRSPIDSFVLKRLETAGLAPNPPASRTALIRRAYYDMLGVPPAPADVTAFLADKSPDAWVKVVDKLLASPQYGVHWARHWLDLVRYGETNSYERDSAKPNVWRYRDYVVDSLNSDKPYDRFVTEQLAGDELPQRTPEDLIGTGYYRLGIWDDEPSDPQQALYDDLDDIASTTGQVFLGLTVGCARCHDHKLDPIPQKDYYSFLSFFNGIQRFDGASQISIAPEAVRKQQAADIEAHDKKVLELGQAISAIEHAVTPHLSPVDLEEFKHPERRIDLLRKRIPTAISQADFDRYVALQKEGEELTKFAPVALASALCVREIRPAPRVTHILMRGNPHVEGDEAQPAFLSVLAPPTPNVVPPANGESSGRRLALAKWIASPSNPLTARVMANRIWQYHFGRGIVATPNNYGFQGAKPTHPELLDWLASELVRNGWHMKPIHRMILLSSAYAMSSAARPDALKKDPENDLLWRFSMRRLDAEEIRDSILAVNGSLNLELGGPSVYPEIPAEVLAGQSMPGSGWGKSTEAEQHRRSLYIHVKRSLITPILASFDGPEADFTCPVRFATTQPTQALGMLNSAFINKESRSFADYLIKTAGPATVDDVRLCLRRTLQREPSAKEVRRGVDLITSLEQTEKMAHADALTYFCLMAYNLDEFMYLE